MPLASAPPVFAYWSSNYPTNPPNGGNVSSHGTAFTAGASGADAAAVTLLTALAHDVHLVQIKLNGINGTTTDANAVADLLIDPAGGTSWTALIEDLACGFTNSGAAATVGSMLGACYTFPLYIPAGATVGLRAKTAHTADITTGLATIEVFGEPSRPEMWWCGSGVETLGVSDSKGTAVTSGSTNTWGSWTSVGSTTSKHIKAIQLGINGSDATAANNGYYFQVGAGSSALPGSATLTRAITSGEAGYHYGQLATYCNIAAGTQLQVRGNASGTAEVIYVGIYGVY